MRRTRPAIGARRRRAPARALWPLVGDDAFRVRYSALISGSPMQDRGAVTAQANADRDAYRSRADKR
jgi:hypothetical protein